MTIRAHFDGKVIIPEGPVNLPTDRPLEIDVREAEGAPASVLQMLDQLGGVSSEALDDPDRAIEAASPPASTGGVFDGESA